jgi:5-methylthioadenosine/S-adenosylhomocysteine deaminase
MTTTPEIIDLLIEARWIATVAPDTVLKSHAVAVDNGRILSILPAGEARVRYAPKETVSLQEHILIPGLINLHTHAAMSLMRGLADDLPLMDWLQKHIWPAEAAHMSTQFVYDGTRLACAEMLKGGITCFNDMYFYPEAAAAAAAEFGMRAVLGITALEFPTPYASDAADYLGKGLAVRETWRTTRFDQLLPGPARPVHGFGQHFRAHPDTLGTAQPADPLPYPRDPAGNRRQPETQFGLRPLERLNKLGLLGPNFIGVHAVHLDNADLKLLADTGCSIAHCPTSNLKLASGFAPVAKMRQHGINVGLGTDGAASNNRLDLFGEMRMASLLAKGLSGDASALPSA